MWWIDERIDEKTNMNMIWHDSDSISSAMPAFQGMFIHWVIFCAICVARIVVTMLAAPISVSNAWKAGPQINTGAPIKRRGHFISTSWCPEKGCQHGGRGGPPEGLFIWYQERPLTEIALHSYFLVQNIDVFITWEGGPARLPGISVSKTKISVTYEHFIPVSGMKKKKS